jgi:DNA primase
MSSIDEIKSRIDIVDLVSETVKLRRSGKNFTGFCPFHANTRTPAFVVFPESGTWRCFGQCNEGGDIFRYVMKKEGWDFPEALKRLAERAGVQLQPLAPEERASAEEHDRLRSLLEEAVTFYRHQLFHTTPGRAALDYLHHRSLKDETIEAFGLGYAPHAWDAAMGYFTSKGYTPQELGETGLVSERESGEVFDRFRHRIMFPIRDPSGRMAGFGARILDPNDVPKFLNSPQTVLFDKGRLLYGLDQARKAIRTQDQAVIVEGYLDVIALHQGGFSNTVSPMGTALTEEQLHLLKRFTRRFVLALDADAAGQKATLRGLELARQALDHGQELAFDARGLLRHEARLQADMRVTTLPAGMDPDEVVNRDPAEWAAILQAARPVVIHVMETLAAGRDLDDPKVKSEIAARVLPLVEDVPNPVEREDYRQRLARLLRVNERALIGARPAPARTRRGRAPAPTGEKGQAAPATTAMQPSQASETFVLKSLLRRPDLLYLLDRSLQKASLSRMALQDFDHTDYQLLLRLVQQALEQDDLDPQQYVLANIPETLQDLAQELLQPPTRPDAPLEAQLEALYRAVIRLRFNHLTESLEQLIYLQQDLQQQGDLRALPYQDLLLQHTRARDLLDRALKQPLARE